MRTAAGELGTDGYQSANSNLFHFGKQVKLINFGDYSTTGYSSSSGSTIAGRYGQQGGAATSGQQILSSPASRQRRIVQPRYYLRNNALGSAQSLLFNLSSKIKNRLVFNVSRDRFNLEDNRLREVLNASGTDTFGLRNDYRLQTADLWLKNDLKIMTGENSRLDFNTEIVSENTEAVVKSLASGIAFPQGDETNTTLNSKPRSYQFSLKFVRRINDNTALNLQGTTQHENYRQFQQYTGRVYTNLFGENGSYGQRMNQRHNNQAFGATVLRQAGSNKWQYFASFERLRTTTEAGLLLTQNGEAPLQVINYGLKIYASGIAWNRTIKRWTVNSRLNMSYYNFGNKKEAAIAIAGTEEGTVTPQFSLRLENQINARNKVALSLESKVSPITPAQAVPVTYLSSQTSLVAGLDSFFLVKTQTAGLNYNHINSFKQYGYGGNLQYSRTPNAVWTTYSTEDFIVINQLAPGGNSSMLQSTAYANAYLFGIRTGIKVSLNHFSFRDQISFAGESSVSLTNSVGATFQSSTKLNKWFRYSLRLNVDRISNKVLSSTSRQSQFFMGQKIILTPGKAIKGMLLYDFYLPQLGTGQTTVQMLSLSFDHRIPESPFEVGFGVNNMLNQGAITERSVTPFLRTTRGYSLRPRTIYCSVGYKF